MLLTEFDPAKSAVIDPDMQAMCNFRGVEFFQFLYAGDNLDHSNWDPRSLSDSARLEDKEKIALLAFEFACRI